MNAERNVPVRNERMAMLQRREIRSLNVNYFLLWADFKPGPGPIHPNTITNHWHKLVQVGLGIDCKMYSLKHKGTNDKINAGMELDVLRSLNGHKSKQKTEVYARDFREITNRRSSRSRLHLLEKL